MTELVPTWLSGALVPVDKIEVHRRGLMHKAVSVFVVAEDTVLIQRRALGKYHTPGLWANTCCTHPRWDENATDCAMRRLDEELGITGLALKHRDQVEYRADVGGGMHEHEVVDIFVANTDRALHLKPNPAEVMATRWVERRRLELEVERTPELFTPWLRIYLELHGANIFGM